MNGLARKVGATSNVACDVFYVCLLRNAHVSLSRNALVYTQRQTPLSVGRFVA